MVAPAMAIVAILLGVAVTAIIAMRKSRRVSKLEEILDSRKTLKTLLL